MQVIVGLIGRSSAVIADGVHTLSDMTTDVVAIFGIRFSNKRANKAHPYGYGQVEYITSIFIGVVVVIVGLFLINSTMNNATMVPSIYVVIVTIITIITKYILSNYVLVKGYRWDNSILIASGRESHADVISSIFVLTSSLLAQLTRYSNMFIYSDRVAAILVSIFIIRVGFKIVSENISVIIGEQETNQGFLDEVKEIILKENKIEHIDNIVALKFGPYYKLNLEVKMDGHLTLKDVNKVMLRIKKQLKKDKKIRYITIQVNN